MVEIRAPEESDRDAIASLASLSFNVPISRARLYAPKLRLDRYLCAYERGTLVATTQAHPLEQWFGGRPVPMAGVASVATVPERRGTGIASQVLRELLRARRDAGDPLTALYPATVPVYRRLGYEFGGVFITYGAPLRSLPRHRADAIELEPFEGDDFEELKSCHRAYAAGQTGLAHSEDQDWWRVRVLSRLEADTTARAVIARGPNGAEGYAAYEIESLGDHEGSRVACSHLVGLTGRALSALLTYFGGFQGVGRKVTWQGSPQDPIALLVPEQTTPPAYTFRWMERLLDVQSAFEARGFAEVSGEAVFTVDDPLFEENRGPFGVEADAGKVRVRRVDDDPNQPIPIGALSAMFTGFLSPSDAIRLGLVPTEHPALPLFTRLFAGPPPWMMDFF